MKYIYFFLFRLILAGKILSVRTANTLTCGSNQRKCQKHPSLVALSPHFFLSAQWGQVVNDPSTFFLVKNRRTRRLDGRAEHEQRAGRSGLAKLAHARSDLTPPPRARWLAHSPACRVTRLTVDAPPPQDRWQGHAVDALVLHAPLLRAMCGG